MKVEEKGLVLRMDKDLHKKFKAYCLLEEEVSMNKKILELIEKELENKEKK